VARAGAKNSVGIVWIDICRWRLSLDYVCAQWLAGEQEDSLPMGLSLYVMMGIFLLLAARNPSVNRAEIVFAAWLNIAHATVMTVMAVHLPNERQGLLIASAVFAGIGAVLILLAPAKQPAGIGSR
jgi:Family of unknown function (DUF6632)